jgi:CDP-diacylglycerol--glycerol-3-phosphate 3-phosphatidyltransferase
MIRFVLGPLLFYDAFDGQTGPWFLAGLIFGFLSDIFDGVIARRLHVVTAQLREVDGQVDVWFFIWIAASAWRTHPETVIAYHLPLLVVFVLQLSGWAIDWLKYRRFSNYHAYSAKAFGLSILAATVLWFSYGPSDLLMWCLIFFGTICMLEEIVISLLLPRWTYDVPSLFHAIKIRASMTSP